jgi:hypothetical protein
MTSLDFFFNFSNRSSRTIALRSTQFLTEMTRNLFGSEVRSAGRRVRLTNLLPSVSQLFRQCGSLDVSRPSGPPRLVTGDSLEGGSLDVSGPSGPPRLVTGDSLGRFQLSNNSIFTFLALLW